MKRVKVTFFMIAYNEEKFIKRAIESVQNQTEKDIELYIRNNGSTDNTGDIVRKIAEKDSRIHLVENKINWRKSEKPDDFFTNEYCAMDAWPINKETLGDYISFIDGDDQISPNFVEELLRVAIKNDSQITVCGNYFVTDKNQIISTRLPPDLHISSDKEWQESMNDHNIFVSFYNVFRTHWGKLFKKEFFLKYYDDAWKLVGGRYGSYLDTAVMLRYLQQAENVSCLRKPLYLFTMGAGSTYIEVLPRIKQSVNKSLQAETLFDEALKFLTIKKANNKRNIEFLYQLNWAFIWESISGIKNIQKPDIKVIDRIVIVLNNRIASNYLSNNTHNIYSLLEPLLNDAWQKSENDFYWYTRYPMRLMYLLNLIKEQPDSNLVPVILFGILCDMENQNLLGMDLLSYTSSYIPNQNILNHIRDYTLRHNCIKNLWIECFDELYGKDYNKKVRQLSENLKIAFYSAEFETASELLSELCNINPIDRDAIFYRIQMLELIDEHELAVILSCSARVLYGLDYDMQCLCLDVLGRGKVNE